MNASPSSQGVSFCTARDGVRIAYAVCGEGPPLVKTAHWMSHLVSDWDSPVWRPWLTFLSRHHTVVRFDPRGCGLSERDVQDVSLASWLDDLEAVVRHASLDRFAMLGMSQGGPVAVAYAARHVAQVDRLILYGSYARGPGRRGLPAAEREAARSLPNLIRTGWGHENPAFRQLFTSMFLPGGSEEQTRWFNELQRLSATPDMAARIVEACDDIDVTDLAAEVAAPTLVLHSNGDARVPASEGRLLASLIPNARFEELPSRNHVLLESEPAWQVFTREVERALGVSEPGASTNLGRTAHSGTTSALTAREREILALLAEGMTNKRIAGRLGLSPKTVRNYVSLILGKLGASTRTEAVAKSLRAEAAPGSLPEERNDH